MIRQLSLKPDFAKTIERFEAWWQGEVIDRPPLTLRVRPRDLPTLESQDFVADSFPARVIDNISDFSEPTCQAVETTTQQAIAASNGRFIVGIANLPSSFDTLAASRGAQQLCTDLLDAPQAVASAASEIARARRRCFERLYSLIAAAGMGATTWIPFYHEGSADVVSCDVWCLLSSRIAREFVLPEINADVERLQRSIFHLDGPQALRHLDLLLEIQKLDAIQWSYGDGHGRAEQWIDVYRRVRDAGKSMQVLAADAADALAVLDALGPRGVWLSVASEFPSVAAAENFAREIDRRSVRRSCA